MPPTPHNQAADTTQLTPGERPRHWAEARLAPTTLIRVCPDCSGPIARNSGCLHCLQCGWGKCG